MKDNSENAYIILKDKILNTEFVAGQKLREDMLVDMLEMSRTPIRTALANLARDGLVEIIPKRYSMVAKYSEEYISQIGVARLGLDIMSARLALYYGSNADMYKLSQMCDLQEEAIHARDDNRRREVDCQFHLEICRISKNEVLYNMQQSLYLKVRHILSSHDIDRKDRFASVTMHRKIVAAMFERNEEKTVRYIKEHLFDYYNFDKDGTANIFPLNDTEM